ncbi:hypothetical protein EC991_006407 [Linnemannia zychae]|nr:hypothetical protein EC991_006407 [Linnemannia zychae]
MLTAELFNYTWLSGLIRRAWLQQLSVSASTLPSQFHNTTSSNSPIMHFSATTAASALAIVLATSMTVSAQDALPDACSACLLSSATAVSPSCDSAILGLAPATTPATPEQLKACLCPLVADKAWIQTCISPEACPAEIIPVLVGPLEEAAGTVCSGAPSTEPNPVPSSPAPTTVVSATTTAAPPKTSAVSTTTTTTAAAKPTPSKSAAACAILGTSSKILASVTVAVVSAVILL